MKQNISVAKELDALDTCRAGSHELPHTRQVDSCRPGVARMFDHFASNVARATGSPVAFACAAVVLLLWALAGPWAGFSEVWQLVVNTGTTIVTFLMVFLIQQNQNKDSRALHVKLDELLMAIKGANEKLMNIEDMEEDEINEIAARYRQLAMAARKGQTLDETTDVVAENNRLTPRRKRPFTKRGRRLRRFKSARRFVSN